MKQTYLLLSLLLLISSCKYLGLGEKEKPVQVTTLSLKAVVLFTAGKSTVNGKQIKRGETLLLSEQILVEPRSFLDIQIVEGELTSIIRIKGKASFQMKAELVEGATRFKPLLTLGTALFNVQKMKKQDSFQVITPTVTVGVRGTQFQVTVKDDGSSLLKLTDGEVTSAIRLEAIDSLKEKEILKKSDLVTDLTKPMEQETILKVGEEVDVTQKEVEAFLKKSGLEELVKDPTLVKNLQANIDTPQAKKELRKTLDAFQDKLKTVRLFQM